MNATLTFRRESIQTASHQSEALIRIQENQGQRSSRDQRPITLTTTLTVTQ